MALEVSKLRGMSPDELDKEEQALRDEIWKLCLQRSTGQLTDHHKVRRTRSDLARVMTIKAEQARAQRQEGGS